MAGDFTFISADPHEPAAREAVKVHVLRLRHRQRRKASCGLQKSPSDRESGGQIHIWEPETRPRKRHAHTGVLAENHQAKVPANPKDHETPEEVVASSPEAKALSISRHPSSQPEPTSVVSSWTPEQTVIEYYCLLGGGSKVPRELLRNYQLSSASFHAFLAVSSSRFSMEQGVKSPLPTEELETLAVREVMKQIAVSPSAPGFGTMVAVALLANLQECRNEYALAEWHWNGLKRMVAVNGGVPRLRMNEDLHAFLFWLDCLVCNVTSAPLGQVATTSPAADQEAQQAVLQQELASFLDEISLYLSLMTNLRDPVNTLAGPITTVLQQPCLGADKYAYQKWHRAKLACLFYFAALSLQSEAPLSDTEAFRAIVAEVLDRETSYTVYPEELFLLILRANNQDKLCELIWLVSRLMSVAKLLEMRDLNTCYRLLSAYLGFTDRFQPFDMIFNESQDLSSRLSLCLSPSSASFISV